ncbi:MAG: hypothetical protein ACJ8E7_06800 [Sphingomicrobium sp.]
MTFLSKIRGVFGGGDDHQEPLEEPVRTRTFSASQYREEELARDAETRARADATQIDAAQVLSPAVNPVAESLIAAETEPTETEMETAAETDTGCEAAAETDTETEAVAETVAEPAPAAPAHDPMPWEEAAGWLSQRSAETRNFVGQYWNWDYDLRVLHFLAQQPDLDAGIAAHIFWTTAAAEDYFPFGDDEPDSEIAKQVAWLTEFLGRRFAEKTFLSNSYGFDDSWDCDRLKQRLADLHEEGRIDWSPDAIPTATHAELMSFDDVPEEERGEVAEFLARFGVY